MIPMTTHTSRFLTVFFLLLSLSVTLVAQSSSGDGGGGSIHARVLDAESDVPIEYASAVLYRSADSSMAQGTISNREGRLVLNMLDAGRYYLKLHFMGYEEKTIDGIRIRSAQERLDSR
jgi:hypothetical protein